VAKSIPLKAVFSQLEKLYDPPKTFLRHRNAFDLLIVTILSAQCTDKRVNELSKELFQKYKVPQDYVKVKPAELERDIRSTGFYRQKAKNIQSLCHMLLQNHGGRIPRSMEELTRLPGVGRKTAAIILSVCFEIHEGIAVDTHVMRLARRLGLTKHKAQDKIELDLMSALPKKHWGRINPLLVSHGRAICTARNRKCEKCLFARNCPSSLIMGKRDRAKQ
jgi:endonuclease III